MRKIVQKLLKSNSIITNNGWRQVRQFSSSSFDNQLTPKSINLYSAINQALHIALDTDPRYFFQPRLHNQTAFFLFFILIFWDNLSDIWKRMIKVMGEKSIGWSLYWLVKKLAMESDTTVVQSISKFRHLNFDFDSIFFF